MVETNQTFSWLGITESHTIYYLTENVGRLAFSNNRQQLNFLNLALTDQMYYVCGIMNNSMPVIFKQYYLFVRGKWFIQKLIDIKNYWIFKWKWKMARGVPKTKLDESFLSFFKDLQMNFNFYQYFYIFEHPPSLRMTSPMTFEYNWKIIFIKFSRLFIIYPKGSKYLTLIGC